MTTPNTPEPSGPQDPFATNAGEAWPDALEQLDGAARPMPEPTFDAVAPDAFLGDDTAVNPGAPAQPYSPPPAPMSAPPTDGGWVPPGGFVGGAPLPSDVAPPPGDGGWVAPSQPYAGPSYVASAPPYGGPVPPYGGMAASVGGVVPPSDAPGIAFPGVPTSFSDGPFETGAASYPGAPSPYPGAPAPYPSYPPLGTPGPYDPMAAPAYGAEGPGSGQPPKGGSKTGLILGIVGGVVVLIVIALVLANVLGGRRPVVPTEQPPTPWPTASATKAPPAGAAAVEAAVKGYFEALAGGHADAALAYSSVAVPDKKFLTDAVLQQMVAAHPITNVTVKVDASIGKDYAFGSATYSLGGTMGKWQFSAKKFNDAWMFNEVTTTVDFSRVAAGVPVKIYGVDVEDPTSVTLFPGVYDVTSGNPMLTFGKTPLTVESPGWSAGVYNLKLDLSAEGTKALRDAAQAKLDGCLAQKALKPDGCGFSLKDPPGEKIDETTIEWAVKSGSDKLSNVKFRLAYNDPTTASAYAYISIGLTGKSTTGVAVTGTASISKVTADLTDSAKIGITFNG